MRIPYDSVVLEAVVAEIEPFLGSVVQRISQPDPWTVILQIYKGGLGEGALLLCVHPEFYRIHFTTRRRPGPTEPPTFLSTLRARIMGAKLAAVHQIPEERLVEFRWESEESSHTLIAELMGKHSNLILNDEDGRMVAAAKWVGPQKSSRTIQSGQKYKLPPVLGAGGSGSKFWKKLSEAGPLIARPVLSPGNGAYPYSVASLGLPELPRPSLSVALEQHYDEWIPAAAREALRSSLAGELERVRLAREVAIHDLTQALETGNRAGEFQRQAEIMLAYGGQLREGASILEAWDYEGNPVTLRLDPTLDFRANAERLFDKAKRAKGRLGFVAEQLTRLRAELDDLEVLLSRLEAAETLDQVERLQAEARERRWLLRRAQVVKKEERPYQGYRIREALGPGGVTVLYGETAEANDYLTLRVAKPNDYWLHVRGNTSAHVVIPTQNKPEKVGRELLEFAARVAVSHSGVKHSSYVAVDYTLKKYVRKPKGSPVGSAFYTHEKTLHVMAAGEGVGQ